MANCAPCLRLGLNVVAHYDADLTSGKEAECYYHHFGMPLPKSIQEKITQLKSAQTNVGDDREDEDSDAPVERTPHQPKSMARGKINPDVCAECWKNGHVCQPHCTVDCERLCIDCADGKPCAYVRAKEKDPKPAVHERYRVTVPAARQTRKHRAADISLVTKVVQVSTAGERPAEREKGEDNHEEAGRRCYSTLLRKRWLRQETHPRQQIGILHQALLRLQKEER